ncbi:LuxR C-terminal-related transcriptional regulator [Microlunatus soli]|uniref:GAF domain-containing protein n=1 Tax=Microlunatus soli TaxID=630515 RepID=A0A1H1VP34_9ACTN|nr:LuxR C-terminal-related transcriptional regulator [Microlunatus soli]SDS86455.1 GAF domain-containing protein [Microlunatus soli]
MEAELTDLTAALREADRRLRSVPPDDVHEMCAVVRRALAALAPVDTFYVGLYRGDTTLVMPYLFDDGVDRIADTVEFGEGRLAHWVRATAKPYRYAEDDGRLLHAGVPLGTQGQSQDVVVVPMFDSDDRTVIGLLNVQSKQPDAFDDQFVTAMEWLAGALTVSLGVGSHPEPRSRLYRDHPELDTGRASSPLEILTAAIERLEDVSEIIGPLIERAPELTSEQLVAELRRIRAECMSGGAELAVMVAKSPDPNLAAAVDRTDPLTAREREIAELIAQDSMSNAALARHLMISEKTVKAHVGSILRKLGIRQRAELPWVLGSRSLADRDV